jgi:phospholipid/cholesterol/gamma-HCH transport system substrate-binding protein
MNLRRAIERYLRAFLVIVALMIAGTVASIYILIHERFANPFQHTYSLNAEFSDADSAAGGEGLPVTVAGVQVGTIRNVTVHDGYAFVQMAIDSSTLPHVYANARAKLMPDTPLKDMEVRIVPGGPPARPLQPGATIPLAGTESPIDLDELLSALDTDTRQYLAMLISGAAEGTRGRGLTVRDMLRALGPTTAEARQLGDALVSRRQELARVVHNLALVAQAAGASDQQLGEVVDAGDATLSSLSGQDAALSASLTKLPGTLAAARSALAHVSTLSDLLGPTLTALEPAVRKLPAALGALGPLAARATPIVRDELRPLVEQLEPFASELAPAVEALSDQTPDLVAAFHILNYIANETGYDKPGSWPGFLYWTAWAVHNTDSAYSTEDANGAVARALLLVSCSTLTSQPEIGALLQKVLAVNPVCS